MTEKNWIKVYSTGDSTASYYIEEVHTYIATFDAAKSVFALNEIVQLHNILKYLKLSGTNINEKETAFQGTARKIIGCYFAEKGLDDLTEEYTQLYRPYRDDFWEIFVNYQVIKKTSVPQFEKFAKLNQVYVGSFLAQKAICKSYAVTLRNILLKEPRHFELFLRKYDSVSGVNYEFPLGFTSADISDWARRYCELPDANTNYLQQLSLWSNKHKLKIDDKVLVKAKKAYERIISTYFVGAKGISWSINVNIIPDVPGGISFKLTDGNKIQLDYDRTWLDNERDYPTLLQNLIYVFDFFDKFGRFNFIGSPNASDSLLDRFKTEGKYAYKESVDFRIKKNIFGLTLLAYFDYLAHHDIDMEELFAFCFNESFANAFGNTNFFFTPSPKENSYYIRSKALLPEMDSLLKQFDMYQEDGEIDIDLFELKSTSKGYRNIKSLEERKFVYLNSEELVGMFSLLFSNETWISFPDKKEKKYSFFKHVLEGITVDDFGAGQQRIISEHLKDKGIIGYDVSNRLYFKNLLLIGLYKIIWDSGYISLLNFETSGYLSKFNSWDELYRLIDDEVEKGNLRYGNTLFSEQESDYISYVMDDQEYSNALAIRNKITHGSYAKKSSKEHKDYYLELLMICMMYTIRINDELNYQDLKQNPDKTD